jgi:hypothetical protein
MTLNLNGEKMPTQATTLEGAGTVVSPVPILASPLDVVSTMALDLKAGEGAEMVVSPVALEVVVPMALNLKGEEASTRLVLPPSRTAYSAWLPHPLLRPSHCHVPHISSALL